MLASIANQNRFTAPMTASEKKILYSGIKLFLREGYSETTLKMISQDSGMAQGSITYHFHTKEDMLYMLIQALMEYHSEIIDNIYWNVEDSLLAYAMEITAQISLCEQNSKAWDLYYSAYTHPATLMLIKDWAAEKNYMLFKERLSDWSKEDFREIENVASCIELSAFTTPTGRFFTLERKIVLALDSIMKIYDISEEERREVIGKVLETDYKEIGQEMFEKFVKKLDNEED